VRMLDLFSGIGGFALAASWVWGDELELVGFCENDSYCQQVLAKNFPGVPIYDDITELEADGFTGIDLLTGGFPCQDISVAGKGEGIEGERSGLWFEMLRLISGIRPRYALIENVPMLLHRGFGRVICDLAQIGYDAEWQIISAADVGAPHLRKRIWIVAYPSSKGQRGPYDYKEFPGRIQQQSSDGSGEVEAADTVAYAGHLRRGNHEPGDVELRGRQQAETAIRSASQSEITGSSQESEAVADTQHKGYPSRVQPATIGDRDCTHWSTEPDLGRVADGVPKRVDRLRGLGNAIVPQVAALIMERIRYE